ADPRGRPRAPYARRGGAARADAGGARLAQPAHDLRRDRPRGPVVRAPHGGALAMPIAPDVSLGRDVVIHHPGLVNLYGCTIGDGTSIGAFVEIQKGAAIGRACKISSHSFVCAGVTIEDEVFVGHG